MPKLDLMAKYPRSNRQGLLNRSEKLTLEEIRLALQFGREYFDGDRKFGLGGYYYDPKFFSDVVVDIFNHYNLPKEAKILDVGCGKGFMLYDFQRQYPFIEVQGLDISQYCYEHCLPSIKPFFTLGSCDNLPYEDNSFDIVISIATIHNLNLEGVKQSLREIQRVSREHSFVKVNGYKNEEEKKQLNGWNLVAKTILHETEWEALFYEIGYTGDFDFFKP